MNEWTQTQKWSLITTVAFGVSAIGVAVFSISDKNALLLAVSMGALGGLIHEIAQSGGKILFFEKQEDGYYLGSIAGMALGAVAGILVVRGQLVGIENANMTDIAIEVFMAGLGLKGIAEAASGNAVPQKKGSSFPGKASNVGHM